MLFGFGLAVVSYSLMQSIGWVEKLPGALALGFEVSEGLLFVTYLVILLILFDSSLNRRIIWVGSLIPIFVLLQFPRFQNTQKNEICIFNSKASIILAKLGNDQVCLFTGNERAEQEARLKVKDYQKIYPGKVRFLNLALKNIQVQHHTDTLQFENSKKSIIVSRSDQEDLQIIKSNYYQFDEDALDGLLVLKANSVFIPLHSVNLKNGAYRESF